ASNGTWRASKDNTFSARRAYDPTVRRDAKIEIPENWQQRSVYARVLARGSRVPRGVDDGRGRAGQRSNQGERSAPRDVGTQRRQIDFQVKSSREERNA